MQILWETLAATGGTIAFSLLFGVPGRYYLECGLTGGIGWLLYRLISLCTPLPVTAATFLAAAAVALYSRIAAVRRRCPTTVFLIAGIFPLVPGAGIYYTAYYFLRGDNNLCAIHGFETLKVAVALALGIAMVCSVPLHTGEKKCPKN